MKACFLFLYCLAAITAVGTAVSHLWRTSKLYRDDVAKSTPVSSAPAAPPATQPS